MRSRLPVPARVLVCAALAAATLAGCGGSSASDDTTGASPATRTVTHTETVTPSSSSSSTTATSTVTPTVTHTHTHTSRAQHQSAAAGTGGACVASDLALQFLGGTGATGHGELGFALKNTTSTPCHTFGYPGVQFLDSAGKALPTTPTHTTDDFFGHTGERDLTVAPGASVSFRLGVSHEGAGGGSAGCTTAAGLQVIAPDDTATLRVTLPGGAAECGGAVTVSPVQPGTSAFGG